MSHATVEHLTEDRRVKLMRLTYPEYPYDHFVTIFLPGRQMMIIRDESDDFVIYRGEIPEGCLQDFLFAAIDAVCADKCCRIVPAKGEA